MLAFIVVALPIVLLIAILIAVMAILVAIKSGFNEVIRGLESVADRLDRAR